MVVELIPAERQTLWGRLAVANFFLGGAGAGGYVVGVILWGLERTPVFALASVLGPLLVLSGFLCVALEAGRPLRGFRVLRRIRSSWMSRELWAGGLFIATAAADLFLPWGGFQIVALWAALLLLVAQGSILSEARGVAAWDSPLLPFVFVASGLVTGAGVLGIMAALLGGESARLIPTAAGLLLLSGGGWIGYLAWPGDAAFLGATASLRERRAHVGILGIGHALPLLLLLAAVWFPERSVGFLALGGVAMLIGALWAKAALVLRAGQFRPITLPTLSVRPSRSR